MVINKPVTSEGHTVTEAMSPDCLSLYLFFPSSPLLCGPYVVKFVSTSRFGRRVTATGFKRPSPSQRKTTYAREHLEAIDDTKKD